MRNIIYLIEAWRGNPPNIGTKLRDFSGKSIAATQALIKRTAERQKE
jgi:hypothetical protein